MSLGLVFWLTGLSGSGKSTLANGAKYILMNAQKKVWLLDGDEVRSRYPEKLGFAKSDIEKNNSNILELCSKQRHEYDCVLVPVISPYECTRNRARKKLGSNYHEIYVQASIECVQQRDTKGLYHKAASNQINDLIGFSSESPYEEPKNPELILRTDSQSESVCIDQLAKYIMSNSNLVG
jgi:adenylyl-sulfate kinase